MLPHLKFVMFFLANHICGNAILCMNLDLVVSLLLWENNSTGYLIQFPRLPSLLSHPSNARKYSPKLGNSSSSWFVPKVNERSQKHPPPPHRSYLHNISMKKRSWKHTRISLLHLRGFCCIARSSILLIWFSGFHYLMSRYICAPSWKMKKSSEKFKNYSKKGTSGRAPHLAGALLCWYRRKMGHGNSILITKL